jgi:hypothetical protein
MHWSAGRACMTALAVLPLALSFTPAAPFGMKARTRGLERSYAPCFSRSAPSPWETQPAPRKSPNPRLLGPGAKVGGASASVSMA